MSLKAFRSLLLVPVIMGLGGCRMVLLHPAGDVAMGERDLLIASTLLMLLIILPVMILIGVIAYRYRQSNTEAEYAPDWEHSIQLELVIWAAPLLIIIALGAITWIGTHQLDPYRSIDNSVASKPIAGDVTPMTIDVVSMDWKWLFLYPEYGIATVNQVAVPVGVPVHFRLTSQTVMNSFFVPAVAGQIYTMAGMSTDLHALINKPGNFKGFSANISGDGFTDMRFRMLSLSGKDFDQWVRKVENQGDNLDARTYMALTEPTRDAPVHYYSHYAPKLFGKIVHRCVEPGTACQTKGMMGGSPAEHRSEKATTASTD
ncbi:MAG TPA: ubiquinol oxidase subunit II [Gammaproteobacteria bacterium]|nr:ubiquinol oxidase subunit II [Gammaproteobacteria bacterium]